MVWRKGLGAVCCAGLPEGRATNGAARSVAAFEADGVLPPDVACGIGGDTRPGGCGCGSNGVESIVDSLAMPLAGGGFFGLDVLSCDWTTEVPWLFAEGLLCSGEPQRGQNVAESGSSA